MTRPRQQSPEQVAQVTLRQIAAEIGRSPARTTKLLSRHGWLPLTGRHGLFGPGQITYDAQSLEVLKTVLGITPPARRDGGDWLSDHIEKGPT